MNEAWNGGILLLFYGGLVDGFAIGGLIEGLIEGKPT
jgi:hypothetical protein